MIGSRDEERARERARQLAVSDDIALVGVSNVEAARRAELVIVTVPWNVQAEILADIGEQVQGKIVIDTTVPLAPPKVMRVQLPAEGCAAVRAQALLGDNVRVVAAFHNVAAHRLATRESIDCDVLVFSDDKEARGPVVALANDAGLRGLHGGALANSAAAEALTSVLIFLNKTYSVDGAGIRITGDLQGT